MHRLIIASVLVVVGAGRHGPVSAQTPAQTETDEYARYELLAPATASFKIVYEVTATTAGARYYFNPIRQGSSATDEAVYDLLTGAPLKFEVVTGPEARQAGLTTADADTTYLKVTLARPVPANGQGRLRIEKTYRDPKSYYREGDLIVFNRPLGVRRNSVILPSGFELVSCNVPSQVLSEDDGRIAISFMHQAPGVAALIVKGRAGAAVGPAAAPKPLTNARSWEPPGQGATERARLSERAHQDRDIVYFLQEPSTHAFSLYHDYTESRPGTDKYINVVRTGSQVSSPSAYILDTGEVLTDEILKGSAITAAKLDIGEAVTPDTEVVVVRFPPVKAGQSVRLRISETYTAPESYRLDGQDLVFERSLGRPRDAVVLPAGWYLTASSMPALVSETPDKAVRLDFVNGRPDSIDVLIKARRRPAR